MITVDEVKAAVEKNGFPLKQSTFGELDKDKKPICGCLLTHLYCASNGQVPVWVYNNINRVDAVPVIDWARKERGMSDDFLDGLMHGFDGCEYFDSYAEDMKEFRKGYDDGSNIRLALLGY